MDRDNHVDGRTHVIPLNRNWWGGGGQDRDREGEKETERKEKKSERRKERKGRSTRGVTIDPFFLRTRARGLSGKLSSMAASIRVDRRSLIRIELD